MQTNLLTFVFIFKLTVMTLFIYYLLYIAIFRKYFCTKILIQHIKNWLNMEIKCTVKPVLRGHDLWVKEKSNLIRQVTS